MALQDYRLSTNTRAPAAAPSNPVAPSGGGATDYLSAAGPILGGAGSLAGAYNTFQSNQLREEEYQQALKEYELAKKRQAEIDQVNMQQLELGNIQSAGQYAGGLRQQDQSAANYYADIGV